MDRDGTPLLATRAALLLLDIDAIVVDGPDRGLRVRLDRGTTRIGGAAGNEIHLTDPAVSRVHCELRVGDEQVRVVDCASTNGTHVDGVSVRDADLALGATLRVGATSLRLEPRGAARDHALSGRDRFGDLVGQSLAMRRVFALLERIAPTPATVLLLGETGTGKDAAARAIHEASPRRGRPFVVVDCGAISEGLFESELFGHQRGAFSGASAERRGLFEEAHEGTLFLDEIGELPLALQPKLLRALETRSVRRVGANRERPIDVRIVAATHRSLGQAVNDGTFREDLYFRLSVAQVQLPPLRQRKDDLPLLVAELVERLNGSPDALPPSFLAELRRRSFPGNVRELRNVVERAVLGLDDAPAAEPSTVDAADVASLVPTDLPMKDARVAWVDRFERVYAQAILEKNGGNVSRAASAARVSRRFFQRLMIRTGLRDARDDERE